MTWFAIKGPDGEIIGVGQSAIDAWRASRFPGLDDRWQAANSGYRCVEVQLVEVTAPTGGAESKEW